MAENESQQDDSQKTEDPTPKKIEEARKRGQVALSREVNNWMMLFAGTLFIGVLASSTMTDLHVLMRTYIEQSHAMPEGGVGIVLGGAVRKVLLILAMPFLLFMAVAFLSTFLQVGPLFAPQVIKADWGKISPMAGFSRLFSRRSLVEFVKGVLKICLIGVVGVIVLMPYFGQFEHLIDMSAAGVLEEMQYLVIKMMVAILVVLMMIAIADLVYQRIEYNKKMRMSRQEIKDEYKQSEGDPQIKAKLRAIRADRARKRMMQAVPTADVVITNPTHYSIALKYKPDEMPAPIVVAKGVDDLALRIREVAKEHNIVIFENKPLARALYDAVDVDEMIPTEHFKAVAEVISYVFKLKGKLN